MLVCGRQEILDDNGEVREYYYKSADADVYGYTMHPYEDWISSKMTEKKKKPVINTNDIFYRF